MKRTLCTLVRWLRTVWIFFRCGVGLGRIASVAAHVEQTLHNAGQHRLSAPLSRLLPLLLDARLCVAVFGEFNRGKSTLLNALLGRDILPAKLVPTTGQTIRLVEGDEEEIRIYFRAGGVARSSVQELDRVTSLGINGRARDGIASVEVALTAPLLRGGLVLLDTPGCNESERQTARACGTVAEADLVLLVLDAQKLLSEEERRTARWLIDQLGKPVVVIVNFMNRLEKEVDRQQTRRRLEQLCRGRVVEELGQPWFEVNALGALKHVLSSSPSPDDDFWALRRALLRLQGRKRRQLQQRSRRCWLLAVLKTLEHAHAQTVRSLQQQVQRNKQERETLYRTLRTSSRRWEADARMHRQRLLASAARALEDSLQTLGKQLAGKSRPVLEQDAGSWYEEVLLQSIAALEREANTTLSTLARMAGCSVQTFALADAIDTSFQVTPLSSVLRDLLGNPIGDWLEGWGVGPDYVAVYGEQIRQRWAGASQRALAALQRRYDHACGLLREYMDRQIRTCRREDPQLAAKLRCLEGAQAVLKRAKEQLSSF